MLAHRLDMSRDSQRRTNGRSDSNPTQDKDLTDTKDSLPKGKTIRKVQRVHETEIGGRFHGAELFGSREPWHGAQGTRSSSRSVLERFIRSLKV